MASVELPVEPFVVGAGVNILTTLLFLRKKTDREKYEERLHGPADYPVFMAVAEGRLRPARQCAVGAGPAR